MSSRVLLSAILGLLVLSAAAAGQDIKKKKGPNRDGDTVVGAIWGFTATKDSEKVAGRFRVHKHVVYHDGKKVGTVDPKGANDTTLIVTGYPKLNGKAVLHRVKVNPWVVWRGDLVREDGSKWNISVEVKNR